MASNDSEEQDKNRILTGTGTLQELELDKNRILTGTGT